MIFPRVLLLWTSIILALFQLKGLRKSFVGTSATPSSKDYTKPPSLLTTLFRDEAESERVEALPETIEPCTFDQLWKSFGDKRSMMRKYTTCWESSKELLNIPVEAIADRETYSLIGVGHHGIIIKASIRYGTGSNEVCQVVVKTERCTGKDPINEKHWSCIKSGALPENNESYLGAEYMGGLPFASLRRKNVNRKGFLPAWGVISKEGGLPWTTNQDQILGRPHPDPDVIGIIMPFIKFTPLNSGDELQGVDTLDKKTLQYITKDIPSIAKALLPAARALEHIGGMGISFQKIHLEDVGLIVDRDPQTGSILDAYAMLYDNTNTGFDSEQQCDSTVPEACNFCPEPWFFPIDRKNEKGFAGVDRDFNDFKTHLLWPIIKKCPDQRLGIKFFDNVKKCVDHKCMVKLLEEAANNKWVPVFNKKKAAQRAAQLKNDAILSQTHQSN